MLFGPHGELQTIVPLGVIDLRLRKDQPFIRLMHAEELFWLTNIYGTRHH
jgi:hypothetical protein